MGSNLSKANDEISNAAFDDTDIRERLIDLLNNDPLSFEDDIDDVDHINVRPYGAERTNRRRSPNLWESGWGRLILSEEIKVPNSYEDKLFRKRFRMPFVLFTKFVKEAKDANIFEELRSGKIAIEFKIMIGLRILGRDNCADDISEYLNIGESTISPIFKQFVNGCVKYLYSKYVYVPEEIHVLHCKTKGPFGFTISLCKTRFYKKSTYKKCKYNFKGPKMWFLRKM